jgi:cyclopropane fatty-acyl-phospholipid synthase-like methyltransferase
MMVAGLRVPFVPTPEPVVRRMLILANVRPAELVYDLGAGDGRILSSAAQDFAARAVGVELHASRYADILERVKRERLTDQVKIILSTSIINNTRITFDSGQGYSVKCRNAT